jgi:hypothetical protein
MIRGLGTVLGGRTPLYVVDGMFTDNINNINSNDILTYDVLKDAAHWRSMVTELLMELSSLRLNQEEEN